MDELTKAIIEGPVNTTAYYIWKYSQKGDLEAAKREYQYDGDKLNKYFQEPIEKLLGCRLHLVKDCQKPFCKRK